MDNYAKVKAASIVQDLARLSEKPHQAANWQHSVGGIDPLDLQRFYKHLLDGGRVDRIEAKKKPKGLAPKTVRNIHQMICSAYNLAMEQKLVTQESDTRLCTAKG